MLHLNLTLMALISPQAPAAQSPQTIVRNCFAMGTTLRISCRATTRPEAMMASEAALAAIELCESQLSTWRPQSELSRLNRSPEGKCCQLSAATLAALHRAKAWNTATQGAFDPGAGELFKLWGLRQAGRIPTGDERKRARRRIGLAGLSLEANGATRPDSKFRIDAGAFGKGLGLDRAIAAARKFTGVEAIELEFGGQLAWWQVRGSFRVGIRHPSRATELIATLELPSAGSIATSGNGERRFVVEGKHFGHLIDPRSGMPADDFGSLTVVAPSAFDADCLATGLYVLGAEKALAFAAEHKSLGVVVAKRLTEDQVSLHASPSLRRSLHRIEACTTNLPRTKTSPSHSK